MATNCSALNTYTSFREYVKVLRNVTSVNLTVAGMEPCRSNICSTLYGVGNTNISGIGVVVGYITHLSLGILLGSAVVVLTQKGINSHLTDAIFAGYESTVIMLVKKDFGLSAADFGELTIEVTWAAALLTILPILLVCLIRPETSPRTRSNSEEGRDLPLAWISVTWILFFFTFVSRMIGYYSKGQVGSGGQAVISTQEAKHIHDLCFRGFSTVSAPEHLAFDFFAIGGSLFTSIIVISILVDGVGQKQQFSWSIHFRDSGVFARLNTNAARGFLIFSTVLWGAPQILTIFRFRNLQSALARSIDMANIDNEWSFGQIMAVVVFLPVPIQFVYELLQQPQDGESSSLHQTEVHSDSDKTA